MGAAGGHVAQWIAHLVPVQRVGGSNPSMLALIFDRTAELP
jgi:hypothetical protein